MDSFNKVISFVLGLVVVLVFFAVITGKLNLKGKTSPTTTTKSTGFFNFGKSSPTSTPTPTPTKISSVTLSTSTKEIKGNNLYKQNDSTVKTSNPKSIPSTGLPTLFIPTLISGLLGGSFLRKAGKKN